MGEEGFRGEERRTEVGGGRGMTERQSGCEEEDEEEKEEIMRRGVTGTERGEAKQGLWGRDMAVNEVE